MANAFVPVLIELSLVRGLMGSCWVWQQTKERYIPKMFLRGDSVVIVLANPH
jgi:hypothetical protein